MAHKKQYSMPLKTQPYGYAYPKTANTSLEKILTPLIEIVTKQKTQNQLKQHSSNRFSLYQNKKWKYGKNDLNIKIHRPKKFEGQINCKSVNIPSFLEEAQRHGSNQFISINSINSPKLNDEQDQNPINLFQNQSILKAFKIDQNKIIKTLDQASTIFLPRKQKYFWGKSLLKKQQKLLSKFLCSN